MTDSVTRGLEAASLPGRFKVAGVDCRTTLCIALLEWTSQGDALASQEVLIHSLGDVPCSREILFEQQAPAARYAAPLVLQCERRTDVSIKAPSSSR
jgi:hypothetical protein